MSVHVTVIERFVDVAPVMTGPTNGGATGITAFDGVDGGPVPALLVATTRKT
jgi:hypothetical protein